MPTATSTSDAPCSNAAVVASWPVARRAATLVIMPVLDFDVAAVMPAVRAGAGGVLFLGSGATPGDLTARVRSARAAAPTGGFTMVMADQEGGGIQRLGAPVPSMPWPRDMAATMSTGQVQALAARVARAMRALGVTVDLAPVLDVDDRPGPSASNPDGSRSFSGESSVAGRYGVAFAQGMLDGGVVPVVKHFPGLGGSSGNTDNGAASTRPIAALRASAIPPFAAAVAAGIPAVMTANASVPGVTAKPASLSRAVTTGLLRDGLGFQGLVVTDSLSAGAVSAATPSLGAAAVAAVSAGADVVLFGSTLDATQRSLLAPAAVQRSFRQIVDALTAAVNAGTIPTAMLDAAVDRVLSTMRVDLCRS